ncbi:MAG: penicillin acylase family protein [Acidobacteriota bacterium]
MKRLLIAVVVLVFAAATAGWWWARGSVPSLDAAWSLPGLHGPVEVISDAHGVPHVYARDTDDAWFVAGALHARDRLWQMELYRRATGGRLAEVLGERALDIDRRMLTLRIRAAAEAEFARLGAPARAALTRYADGVNAALLTIQGRRRPPELQLLGITPAAWTPQDSLAVGRLLAFRLSENVSAELVRYAIGRTLSVADADQLTGRYPDRAPTVLGELVEQAPLLPAPLPAAPAPAPASAAPTTVPMPPPSASLAGGDGPGYPAALAWLDPSAPRANSNAWVVSGKRTATGRPILANDPHLLIELPSVWYEMHLVAAGLDVQGVSLPGTPFVAIGHNARIAWGFTNSGADVQDLVLERFDLKGKRVQAAQGWEPVQVEAMAIPVRGHSTPVPFEVWRTSSGVVYADESTHWEVPPPWLSPDAPREGEQRALVLRWSGFADGNYADAIEALDRAATWTDFQAALDQMSALSQNAVYADVDGNIGYLMTGQLPVRAAGDGARPLAAAASVWSGSIAGPGALPRAFNPERGYLASANNPITRGRGPFVTRDWVAPYRATTITDTLANTPTVDMAAATGLQLDVRSGAADDVLQGLDGALARAKTSTADGAAVALLERLKAWNRQVDGSEDAAAFEAFEDRLWRRTFADELPDEVFTPFYQWAGAERTAGLYVIAGDPASRWWDDIGTVERRESRDDIFLLAAADAAQDVAQRAEGARGWDQVHAATFAHALGDGGRLLAWFFNRGPVPVGGDGTTVMRISHRRLSGFKAWEHPSWRQVFDVGAWDNSKVVLPTGQSGNPLSPFYFDQNELWRAGHYRTLTFSRGAVDGAAAHRQILAP